MVLFWNKQIALLHYSIISQIVKNCFWICLKICALMKMTLCCLLKDLFSSITLVNFSISPLLFAFCLSVICTHVDTSLSHRSSGISPSLFLAALDILLGLVLFCPYKSKTFQLLSYGILNRQTRILISI